MKNKMFNLFKIMLKNSHDMSEYIDENTKKINKKSAKVWATGISAFAIIYITYLLVDTLKDTGAERIYIYIFFFILQLILALQTTFNALNVIYFSEDTKNYLYMPIPTIKLLLTKFGVIFSIIIESEMIFVFPSIITYGIRTIQNLQYYITAIFTIILLTIFFSVTISTVVTILVRIFRFIKNKKICQNTILIIMTTIILFTSIGAIYEIKENIQNKNFNTNSMSVTNWGIEAVLEINNETILNLLKIFGIDVIAIIIFMIIGKKFFLKNILYINSMITKKKNKNVIKSSEKNCKKNKNLAYFITDVQVLLRNHTYFMNYIYKVLIILMTIILLTIISSRMIKSLIEDNLVKYNTSFGFYDFSFILIIIQILFTFSASTLTAVSRYGKNAIFIKYIPIKQSVQFILKTLPGVIINTLIILTIAISTKIIMPHISILYILGIIGIAMLINIINCYILLMIDISRPKLNYINEITVVKQNDNNIFKYILTLTMCLLIWYLEEVTKGVSLNLSILIEVLVLLGIVAILNIIILKRKDKLFKKIY